MRARVVQVVLLAFILLGHGVGHPPDEIYWETPDFIVNNGYPLETHTIVGLDGYILTYFRIPHGKYSRVRGGDVVIIRHALALSSRDWFMQDDPKLNLPFMLAEAGHDVWLGNSRGTVYSSGHVSLSQDDLRYWDYSFHDIGTYDIPAVVNYILKKTGKAQVSYIGHSMSCTSLVVFLNQHPQFNAVIKRVVFIAPALYLEHVHSITNLLKIVPGPKWEIITNKIAGGRALAPWFTRLMRKIGPKLCSKKPGVSWIFCAWIKMLVVGKNFEGTSEKTITMLPGHMPQEISAKEVIHFLQWYKKPWIRQYDYGKKANMEVYGSPEPPDYHMNAVRVPTLVMFGANDIQTEMQDIMRAIHEMDYGYPHLVDDPKFHHVDFVYSWRAPELVYTYVVDFLR